MVKVILVCYNRNEHADIVSVLVRLKADPRSTIAHLVAARQWAKELGWKDPMIAFDESMPEFALFKTDDMEWDEDTVIDL